MDRTFWVSRVGRAWCLAPCAYAVLLSCAEEKKVAEDEDVAAPQVAEHAPDDTEIRADEVIERHGEIDVVWSIAPTGAAKLKVLKGGSPVPANDVTGTLAVTPLEARAASRVVPLVPSGTTLGAKLGPLDTVLTEMRYTLDVAGTIVEGAVHVPRDGTEEIVAAALAAATTERRPGRGPHGGVVQVVGEDIVEIVGVIDANEMRVYLLDNSLQAIRIGDQTVDLSMVFEDHTAFVTMTDRSGLYYDAEYPGDSDPTEITVVVTDGGEADIALVGYQPGDAIAAGRGAPKVRILVAETPEGDVGFEVEEAGRSGKPKKPKKGKGKDRHEDD